MADKGSISGLILKGTRIDGKLSFNERMRIDGEFIGEIESANQLIVGKSAVVNATIKVGELIVMGTVKGNVASCDNLQIHEGGKVIGDICVKTLDIKPGALFDGKCSMMGKDGAQAAQKTK